MRCSNPSCGCPVNPEDDFCPNCGRRLDETTKTHRPTEVPAAVAGAGPALSATPAPAWPASPPAAAAPADPASDCPDLEVLYNNNCVFVLNMQSTFDLEIRPLTDGIRDLFVEVRQSGRTLMRERPMMVLRRGVKFPISLNYIPQNTSPGSVAFTIVVGYKIQGRPQVYAAAKKHTLYNGKEDPRRVCDNLVIEVKNNIEQGHAGDIKVDQDFRELRHLLGQQDRGALDKEFMDLINRCPIWSPLPLCECDEEAQDSVGGTNFFRRGVPPRLVLKTAAGPEYFFSLQSRLQLGRARECDVVTRILAADGQEDREASTRLSRYHASLEWRDHQVFLLDRGFYPGETSGRPSAAGVWADGQRVPSGGELLLRPGREYQVTLADPAQGGYPLAVRVWTVGEIPHPGGDCQGGSRQEAACVLVRPAVAGPTRAYALVRLGLSLGWLDPQFGPACLCRQRTGLRFCHQSEQTWLALEKNFRAGNETFQILNAVEIPKTA